MSEAATELRVPAFKRGVKFRFDTVRDTWAVLAPERMFVPDQQAVEVLKLIDGQRTLRAIVDDLCVRYDAPPDLVMADVAEMVSDLADKGVLTW
jgi:pyrroloquinoline quinone biosynthesis protein D